MKTLLTTIVILAALTAKAQNGNGALIGGSAIFATSIGYYVLGKPTQPLYSKGMDGLQFNKDYADWIRKSENFQTYRTIGLAVGTVSMIGAICIKTIKVNKKSNVVLTANNFTFTYKF